MLRHRVWNFPGENESQKQKRKKKLTLRREKHKKCRKYLRDSSLKLSWSPARRRGFTEKSRKEKDKGRERKPEPSLSRGRVKTRCNYAGGTSSPFREGLRADLFFLSPSSSTLPPLG